MEWACKPSVVVTFACLNNARTVLGSVLVRTRKLANPPQLPQPVLNPYYTDIADIHVMFRNLRLCQPAGALYFRALKVWRNA